MRPIELLADLFECGGSRPRRDLKHRLGVAYAPLRDQGVLVAAPDVMLYQCRDCGDTHEVERVAKGEADRFRCYCPAIGTRRLDHFDPLHAGVSQPAFAEAIFRTFLDREGVVAREQVLDAAWEAVTAESPLPRPVFLARGMREVATYKKVEAILQRASRAGRAVLFAARPPDGLASDRVEIFDLPRILELGPGGFGVVEAARRSVRAAVSAPKPGHPGKGRDVGEQLFRRRVEAGQTADTLKQEAEAICAKMKTTHGAKAPNWKTVEDWIRSDFWEQFSDRRR